MKPLRLSVVSPVYGSPTLIPELCGRLHRSLITLTEDYEIILVFDCSPDDGWNYIRAECGKDARVKGIHLSRNFGQHAAITAGLRAATGEWVVVMDCDLQDRPEEISALLEKAQTGYDIVFAQRTRRKDSLLKRLSSRLFYAVFSYMTETRQDATIANFGIYHQKVIQAVLSMRDYVRYFPAMAQWVGFRSTAISVEHAERQEGASTYSWKKLFRLAFDNMVVFSDKPLRLTVTCGMVICVITGLISALYVVLYFIGVTTVGGFTSLILSIWFLGGVVIFLLGVLGLYLGKTFDQVKDRPVYLIQETQNLV